METAIVSHDRKGQATHHQRDDKYAGKYAGDLNPGVWFRGEVRVWFRRSVVGTHVDNHGEREASQERADADAPPPEQSACAVAVHREDATHCACARRVDLAQRG